MSRALCKNQGENVRKKNDSDNVQRFGDIGCKSVPQNKGAFKKGGRALIG